MDWGIKLITGCLSGVMLSAAGVSAEPKAIALYDVETPIFCLSGPG